MQIDNKINVPSGGLVLDSYDRDVDPQSVTYAMASVREDHDGNTERYASEPGNLLLLTKEGYQLVGHVNLLRDEVVLFYTNGETSEIGIQNNRGYTPYIISSGLNLNPDHPVKGIYKNVKGCERTIYFHDFYNPDRTINLDSLRDYTDLSVEDANLLDGWDVNRMRLVASTNLPEITSSQVINSGGLLYLGLYAFAVEILDSNLNPVVISRVSNPVDIYDETSFSAYSTIDGGYNLDFFQAADGGVPKANKSIRITIENIPQEYVYLRVLVVRKTSGDGITKEVFKKQDLIEISGSTVTYTFTGITDFDTRESYDYLITGNPFYEKSREMIQVDRRLVRANLEGSSRDYSTYQRSVNDITAKWKRKRVFIRDSSLPGDPLNDQTYFNTRSLAGDEVYALGISFLHDDYTESPVFPLIGRAKNAEDQIQISFNANNPDHKHIPFKEIYEKWEIYNTAQPDGTLGYYESESTYPTITDCDDEPVFGELAGTPIRHFKMPDRRLVPIYSFSGPTGRRDVNLIGLEFANIVYPDSSIIGHKFHIVPRTEDTKTVLDTGFAYAFLYDAADGFPFDRTGVVGATTSATRKIQYVSPKTIMGIAQGADHIKLLAKAQEGFNTVTEGSSYPLSGSSAEIEIYTYIDDTWQLYNVPSSTHHYRQIETSISLGRRSQQPATGSFDKPVSNVSFSNNAVAYALADPLNSGEGVFLIASKRYIQNLYGNLTGLRYKPLNEKFLTLSDSQEIYGGDVFLVELRYFNIFDQDNDTGFLIRPDENVLAEYISRAFVESEVNYALVHPGLDCNARYEENTFINDYAVTKVATLADDGEYLFREAVCPEFYGYNLDYRWEHMDKFYFSIPVTFDYCSACSDKYPNRIAFSPVSFPEEAQDLFRINLFDDYITVGENTGEITGLHYDRNRILVRTEQSRFQLSPNPQAIATDIDSLYLATGDFLSLPPSELLRMNIGYAGGQGRFDELATPAGLFSVDQSIGQVFLIRDGIEDLSSKKYRCYHFFRENLPSFLLKQIEDYPHHIPHEKGIGVILAYDPMFNRVILHKRDYEVLNYTGLYDNTVLREGSVVYNPDVDLFFVYRNNQYSGLNFGDPVHFRDRSFTISFSLDQMTWTSFHPYFPDWLYNSTYTLFNSKGHTIYNHTERNFGVFYNVKHDAVIEYVVSTPITSSVEGIEYYAQTFIRQNEQWVETDSPTFDRVWVYTKQQSSGIQNLNYLDKQVNPYGRLQWDNTTVDVIRAEQNYRINAIRDYAEDVPVSSSLWEDIQGDYPIDKVPVNIETDRNMYDLIPVKDKNIRIRFFFKPEGDYKMTLDIVNSKVKQSEL
jgi:hypothetical protein